jgi:prepilin-type N-terminal cleavage/methylation domain-containing protein
LGESMSPDGSNKPTVANAGGRAFTLIEMVGVLSIIAILAALLVPRVMAALNDARLNNVVSSYNAVKSAAITYYGKYGTFANTNGTALTLGSLNATNWDARVLLSEGLLERPFGPRIGDAAYVQVVAAPADGTVAVTGANSAYSLDGGTTGNDVADGTFVVECVVKTTELTDARELSRRIDGDSLSTTNGGSDKVGRVKYDFGTAKSGDLHMYVAHE